MRKFKITKLAFWLKYMRKSKILSYFVIFPRFVLLEDLQEHYFI